MENLKSAASGFTAHFDGENTDVQYGFTKLEKAALMIAQGGVATWDGKDVDPTNSKIFASNCVLLAKLVLEEANK